MSAPRRRGRYTLAECIGTGGVAEVFLATAEGAHGFEKQVVVKCLKPSVAETPEILEGLRTEAAVARRLGHGNIVAVLDFDQDEDGAPFLVMEYVDGCSLRQLTEFLAARGETMARADALRIVQRIADALRYVHGLTDDDGTSLHLVHRDVTPNNILLSRDGVIKLTDFGIAKAGLAGNETLPGVIKGTPRYLSPEQAAGRRVDGRTDIYALGLVLGELVGEHDDETLAAIVARATEPAVRDRYPDVDAFAEALDEWALDQRLRTTPDRLGALVREVRGASKSAKKVVDLDAALRPALATQGDETRQHEPPPPAPERRPLPWAGAAVLAALVAAGVWWSGAIVQEPAPAPAQAEATAPKPKPEPEPAPAPAPEPAPGLEPEPQLGPATGVEPVSSPVARGRLKVNLLPYADVTLDGRRLGRTPVDTSVPTGRHRIVLSNPDTGKRVRRVIEVERGKLTQITDWSK